LSNRVSASLLVERVWVTTQVRVSPQCKEHISARISVSQKVFYKQSADLCEVASALNFPDVALLTLNNMTDWTCQ